MRAIIFFLTFSIFAGLVIWRTDKAITSDKINAHQTDMLGQIVGISKALNAEVNSLQNIMELSFSEIDRNKSDYPAGKPYSKFQMMGQVLPPPSGSKGWQIISQYYLEKTETRSWANSYVSLALESLSPSQVRSKESYFAGILDPQRKPYLLMIYNLAGNWYIGLLSEEVFQATLEKVKNQKSSHFVVNLQGQALAHGTREYIGSMLTEDPIVLDIMRDTVDIGNNEFKNLKGEKVQGLYQRVEGTNVFAVVTTPIKAITGSKEALRLEIIFLGAGLLLIGLAVFFLSDRDSDGAVKVSPPLPQPPPQASSFTSQQVNTSADKMKAYTHVASALSHELKPAVTSILGYSQIALSGTGEQREANLEKIIHEAREAREVLQKLLSFAGEDKFTVQSTSLDIILNRSLKNIEAKLANKGVKLTKQIIEVEPKDWPFDLLIKALESVLINALEAMDRAPKKELTVRLDKTESHFVINITDTGEGIAANNISKVFDPFFTTRSSGQHAGLGLSTALGIVKELKGEISIDSELGRGTSVTITLPNEGVSKSTNTLSGDVAVKSDSEKSILEKVSPMEKVIAAPSAAISAEEFKLKQVEVRPMDPLIVDTTIERLIEGDIPDMPPIPGRGSASSKSEIPQDDILSLDIPSVDLSQSKATLQIEPNTDDFPDGLIPLNVNMKEEKKAVQNFSAKIEKPKIQIKRKSDAIDSEAPLVVRKPGESL